MAKGAYIGVGGVARNVKKNYIGIGGVARNVTKAYLGVDGVARQYFGSGIGSLPEGSIIQLNENGSPQEFYVAKHNYESGLNGNGRTLLVRRYQLPNDINNPIGWGPVKEWGTRNSVYKGSTIDTYFEETYLPVFDSAVQTAIGTTKIYSQGSSISCSIFAPSLTELGLLDEVDPVYLNNIKAEGTELPIASTLIMGETAGPDIIYSGAPNRRYVWTRTYYSRYAFSVSTALVSIPMKPTRKEKPDGQAGYLPAFTLPADFIIPE